VSTGTGVRWHPNLITTLSVPTAPGPCTETWNITATGSWSASCGGSVEIDYYDTALPSPQTLAGTGANPYSLGGSLTGRIPGHAYTVGLVTNFLCNPSVGGTLTINRSIP
jgi:hypothetical protein